MSARNNLRRRARRVVREIARRGRGRQDGNDEDGRDRVTALHEKALRLRAKARKDAVQPKTAAERAYFIDDERERLT
jgi:hypothetical protein